MLATIMQHESSDLVGVARQALGVLSFGVGVVGALVLTWGILVALGLLVRAELCRLRGEDPRPRQRQLRQVLGMYILLGLEILVVADIIETIVAPSLTHLAVLGAIVVIRIVISFTINWELRQHPE